MDAITPASTITPPTINEINAKATYDTHQNLIVNALKQAQQELAQINAATLAQLERSNAIVAQAQQNAVETSNMLAKQALRHADFANDRTWGGSDISQSVSEGITSAAGAQVQAIAAAVSKAVVDALAGSKAA